MSEPASKDLLGELWKRVEALSTTSRGRTLLLLIIGVITIAVGVGIGMIQSPKYDSRAQAVHYLTNHYKIKSIDAKKLVTLTLDADIYRYEYSQATNVVTKSIPDQGNMVGAPLPDRWSIEEAKKYEDFFELIGATAVLEKAAVAALEGKATKSWLDASFERFGLVAEEANPEKKLFGFMALVTAIVGGSAGFELGYHTNGSLSNDLMVKTIMEPESWKGLAEIASVCADHMRAIEAARQMVNLTEEELRDPEVPAELKESGRKFLKDNKALILVRNASCRSALNRDTPIDVEAQEAKDGFVSIP